MPRWVLTRLMGLCCALGAASASATLGDAAQAIGPGVERVTTRPAGKTHTVHTYTDSAGVRIQEYANPAGVVFAVSWRGPALPAMKTLLGPYFENYAQALSAQQGRKYASIQQNDLVVKSAGGARFFVGYAYDRRLMPPDFDTKDLG